MKTLGWKQKPNNRKSLSLKVRFNFHNTTPRKVILLKFSMEVKCPRFLNVKLPVLLFPMSS